jgi:hypothetical protein
MILYNKVKSTFMVDGEVYKRIRILAIERNMEVSAIIEEAMREKLEREFPQYQPLSPPQQQPQQQSQQPQPRTQAETADDKNIIMPSIVDTADTVNSGFPMFFTKINYPINKAGLIKNINNLKNEFKEIYGKPTWWMQQQISIIDHLPANKMYKNRRELTDELDIIVSNQHMSKRIAGNKSVSVRTCLILEYDTEKGKKTMMQKMVEDDDRLRQMLHK